MEKVRAAATVSWTEAVEFATEAYVACGVPPADARKAAEGIVDADLHGTVTHGLKNLRNYVSNLLDGRINPRPNMSDVGGALAARVITADNGLGHVAGHVGMERAIELAHQYGVGTVFVRDSNHYGASGYWARLPLRYNMIGFAFTTASPSVAPWGGKIGQVRVREQSGKDDPGELDTGALDDSTVFLIDRRAAARLRLRFMLTTRGIGRLKHLDLDLEAEQWGRLLYD